MPARTAATNVVKKLVAAGFTAYFAGGWVRDFLMQRPSDDIDIATSASVEEVQALFPKTIPVGVAFGIVIVVEENFHFEVATFRKDRNYVDGRRPTGIEPASAEEDAQRRDFTVNGMFYDPINEKLLDYVEGQKDIQKRVIRAIGSPEERFLEDRLRMMRAVRYSTRFDFPIDEETVKAIKLHAASLLPAVAMERIWQEFKKMSQFAHFDSGLVTLHKLGLLPTIFHKLKEVSAEEIERRAEPIKHFPKDAPAIAELLELFPDLTLEQHLDLCDYLKLSNQEREIVSFLHHSKTLFQMPEEWQKNLEKVEWARYYANPLSELCLRIVAARYPEEKREHFLEAHLKQMEAMQPALERIRKQKPLVRAHHLKTAGVAPGRHMGLLLKECERININEGIEDPLLIIERMRKNPLWPW
ncbi:MAG: CCA tRNA nucleotidyltransferase [Chlamydiales bacterium]|nr:CCA tRNA nucleotidyltransferase [Chlamydiales bacterium]